MGLPFLENRILEETRRVAKDNTLRHKDIRVWSTGKVKVREGETLVHLTKYSVDVAVINKDRRTK